MVTLQAAIEYMGIEGQAEEKVGSGKLVDPAYERALASFDSATAWMNLSLDGQILAWSLRAEEVFGFAELEILGHSFLRLFPPQKASMMKKLLAQARDGIPSGRIETAQLTQQGQHINSHIWLERIEPNGPDGGPVIRLQIQPTKSTSALAAVLKDSFRFLINVLDSLTSQVAILDEGGVIVEVNEAWRAFTGSGYRPSVGSNYAEFCRIRSGTGGSSSVQIAKGLADVLAGEREYFRFEYAVETADQTKWFELLATRFVSDRRYWVTVAHEDVTSLKSARDTLARERAVFHELLETSPSAIIALQRDGTIRFANRQAHTLLGSIPPRVAEALTSVDESSVFSVEGLLAKCVQAADVRFSDQLYTVRKNDGSVLHLGINGAPLPGNNREASGLVLTLTNLTDALKTRQELDRSRRTQRYLAYFDSLTGLPNRRLLQDRFEQLLHSVRRRRGQLAVLFLNIDGFRRMNSGADGVGDAYLREVASRLSGVIRRNDTVARVGGDEFVVIVDCADESDAVVRVVEKLQESVRKPVVVDDHRLVVSVSVGISVFPGDGDKAEDLLKRAEVAMTRSKARGPNGYQFYAPQMDARAHQRLRLEADLRGAFERGELELYFQPFIDLTSSEVVGAEALMRWSHEEFGRVSPSEFIPLAEQSGLIVALGEWALRAACAQLRQWRTNGHSNPTMSVNLSLRQLHDPRLPATVAEVLSDCRIDPSHLMLEVTETVAMADVQESAVVLGSLRDLGVQLAIDDFGSGYTSLGYLKQLPITCLKIDRTFLEGVPTNPKDVAICEALISMSKGLGLRVIAEGVERAEQLAFLMRKGCDLAQGFFLARPLPGNEIFLKVASKTEA
jgi:diguanylate cyclase (GGDEF)-like protein/PAS domain S-box-containing protein